MRAFVAVLALAFSFAAVADKAVGRDAGSRRAEVIRADEELVQLYYSLRDLSLEEQRVQTWGVTTKTKAALWKFNIELYLRTHTELSADAQSVLREGIRLVTTPAWFDVVEGSLGYEPKALAREALKNRAKSVLSPEQIHETFIRFGPEPLTISLDPPGNKERRPRVPQVEWGFKCSCASNFDCGSSSSYDCYGSWCISNVHCGWFGDELCTGKCKSNEPLNP